jgi:hypothetical protein
MFPLHALLSAFSRMESRPMRLRPLNLPTGMSLDTQGPRTRPYRGLEEYCLLAPCDGNSDGDAVLVATNGSSRASPTLPD